MSSLKAHHPRLNQFALLCLSYLFLPKPSLNLTATFLNASQLFPIILLPAESVSMPQPHLPYCPYSRPCMCSEEQFPQQVETLYDFLLHSSEKCTKLQIAQGSNQKPSSEIHSNLVP